MIHMYKSYLDIEGMNDEIQCYVSIELIRCILLVFIILRIFDLYTISVISTTYVISIKPMRFQLNLFYITIELFTFIWRNWLTQVPVKMISFIKFVIYDDIGTLANSLTGVHYLMIVWGMSVWGENTAKHNLLIIYFHQSHKRKNVWVVRKYKIRFKTNIF